MVAPHYLDETVNYPYAFRNIAREINREDLNAFKAESGGLTLKEALTSSQLSGYIPQVFTDEIILTGQRRAIARNNFPVVPQDGGGEDFKQRYMSRDDGAGIYGELDEILHSKGARSTETFAFKKIADWPILSWELIQDSPLAEVSLQVQMGANKIARRENQLMAHALTTFSQGTYDTTWNNHVSMVTGTSFSGLLESLEDAYLELTTSLTDQFDASELLFLIPPAMFTSLWKDDNFRRYDIMGSSPNFVSGNIPNPFGIPYVIFESGYFVKGPVNSTWTPTQDIFLVAPQQAAAIREKVSLRSEPINIERIQAGTVQMWERIGPYVRNPLAMRRISVNDTYSNLQPMADVRMKPKIED